MGKVLKIIIAEIVLLVLVGFLGLMLDMTLQKPDHDAAGHPAPALMMMLPAVTAAVMLIIDMILILKGIFKHKKNEDDKH